MEIIEELRTLTKDYEDKLYNIFTREIDKAIKYADDNKMNSIDKFIYVNEEIDKLHVKLGIVRGSINKLEKRPNYIEPSLTDDFIERICNYIKPVTKEAQNYLKIIGEKIICSTSLERLIDEYQELAKILSHPLIKEHNYITINVPLENDNLNTKKLIIRCKRLLEKNNT